MDGHVSSNYVLTVKGEPGELLYAAFDDVEVSTFPGVTRLSAELDQPALHSLLARIEELGLELIDLRIVIGGGVPEFREPQDASDAARRSW
jgi:hypothetical protein